jgi:hypothetical protein
MPGPLEGLRSLWDRVRPENISDWPGMESAVATTEIRRPKDIEGVKVRPMNWFERWAAPSGASALHWGILPGQNTIAYNRSRIESAGLTPAEVLAHELSHAADRKRMGPLQYWKANKDEFNYPYGEGPLESAAFRAEKNPVLTQRDIALSALRQGR